jgi:hypothetical protein
MTPAPDLSDLVQTVEQDAASDDPLDRLATAAGLAGDLTSLADELVGRYIEAAREAGFSWSDIGAEIGVTKQAAQQRHRARGRHREGGERAFEDLLGEQVGRLAAAPPSPRIRRVLQEAGDAARRWGHNYVGTEHILLALVAVPEGAGAQVLTALGVTTGKVEAAIEQLGIQRFPAHDVRRLAWTPRARRVLRRAAKESRRMGHRYLGTEHVMFALVDGEGVAAEALKALDVDEAKLRAELARLRAASD